MQEESHGYFEEALQNFTRDFAYGGAIKHLVSHGYNAKQIIQEFHYPLPKETIEKMVEKYQAELKDNKS